MIQYAEVKLHEHPEDKNYFAWYDTINQDFIRVNGYGLWEDWKDFESDHNEDRRRPYSLERFKKLYPGEQ